MLQKLVTYGTFGKLFCGVEHTSTNGVEAINGLILKKQQNEFSIGTEFSVDNILNLKNHVQPSQHIFVTINTEMVLFKTLDGEFEHQRALTAGFPNLKIEEFYYEFHTSNGNTYIAICRKDVVENILKNYASNQFNVVGFSLGNLGISQLVDFIEAESIQTSNSIVRFVNNMVSEITISAIKSDSYSINGLQVSDATILSLTGVLTYYMNRLVTNTNFGSRINLLKSNFKQQRIFNLGLKFSLGIVFVSLLVSFMLFTHYSSKIEEVISALTMNKSQKTTLLKLSDEVAKKEKLLSDFSLTSSKSSWHLDQLGQMIPNSVVLTELQWQPVTKAIKEEQQIERQARTIRIKGVANKATDFSQWIDLLEKREWIRNVSINAYGNGKKKAPSFEIELVFKP